MKILKKIERACRRHGRYSPQALRHKLHAARLSQAASHAAAMQYLHWYQCGCTQDDCPYAVKYMRYREKENTLFFASL